jgi:hypothetical protein
LLGAVQVGIDAFHGLQRDHGTGIGKNGRHALFLCELPALCARRVAPRLDAKASKTFWPLRRAIFPARHPLMGCKAIEGQEPLTES